MGSKSIWKYTLIEEHEHEYQIMVPKEATFLTMQLQRSDPTLWFLVDKECEEYEKRFFVVKGTGWVIEEGLEYRGTFQERDGLLVFHVFERVEG